MICCLMKMGSGISETVGIIMITMFILIVVSLHSTHILIAKDSLDAAASVADDCYYFKVHSPQHLYDDQNQVQKVSGEDENEQKEVFIVQKFRALLGPKSFKAKMAPSGGGDSEQFSPAPSPAPSFEAKAPSPAPAPMQPIHVHAHHPPRGSKPISLHPKIQKENPDREGRARRVLVPVLVSTGAVFVVCVLGLIWVCCNKKHHKKSMRTMSVFKKNGRIKDKAKYLSSKKSTSKVNLNPGRDLFYLNSLGVDMEQPNPCLRPISETVNTSSSHSTPNLASHEREGSNQEVIKPESDNASSSSTREITSVHEDVADSIKCESDDAISSNGDKIILIECHSTDGESFHSFNDSHSSNFRLSNASAGSLSDNPEIFSPNVAKKSHPPLPSTNLSIPPETVDHISTPATDFQNRSHQTPSNHIEENLKVAYSPDCHKNFSTSPLPSLPPPPPPPPSSVSYSISYSPSCSVKRESKASCSSPLPNLSPPRNSVSSPQSNQTPQNVLLSPQETSKPSPTLPTIPPPPCPPPFLNQNRSSLNTPPPPPSLFPRHTPLGNDGAPLPKLKPLHWDKVRATPDRSMVWDKLRSSSFELDEQMIESLFGYNIKNSMNNDEAKSKTPSPSKHVLEPKRLQNITILSKALNVTAEQICDALMKGNGLSLQQLEALVKMVPTKEEEAKLSSYKGNINELGSAEKIVKAMLSIPFAFERAEVMLYRETFEDEVVHLRNSFSMLEEACKELRSSRLFLKLLEAVLKTGNRMNVGTIRGGARAFKLDALLKLADVKGTDGKTTLLHFVVQEIIRSEGIRVSDSIMGKINQRNKTKTAEEREEDYRRMGLDLVSGLSTELYNVKKTATIDLDVLASSVSNLSDGMTKLRNLLHDDLSIDDRSESFVHSMNAFLKYAERNIKELQEDESRVLLHVREITEYFHGDVSKEEANPLRIFVIVRDFLGMLDHVCKELRSLKFPSCPNPLAPFR